MGLDTQKMPRRGIRRIKGRLYETASERGRRGQGYQAKCSRRRGISKSGGMNEGMAVSIPVRRKNVGKSFRVASPAVSSSSDWSPQPKKIQMRNMDTFKIDAQIRKNARSFRFVSWGLDM